MPNDGSFCLKLNAKWCKFVSCPSFIFLGGRGEFKEIHMAKFLLGLKPRHVVEVARMSAAAAAFISVNSISKRKIT